MPIRAQHLVGARATAVNDTTQVPDPYGYAGVLAISGLSVYPFGVGDYASCQFTVTNTASVVGGAVKSLGGAYPLFNTKAYFGGVVLDGNGVVVLTFASKYVLIQGSLPQPVQGTLAPGAAVYVTLDTQQQAPSSLSGQSATVVVGPLDAFSGAAVGAPFYAPSSALQDAVTVAASQTGTGGTAGGQGGGPNSPPGGPGNGFQWTPTTIAAAAGAGAVVVGILAYGLFAGRERAARSLPSARYLGSYVDDEGRTVHEYA